MGERALDYHVGHRGFYAAIETKAKGQHPTVLQTRTMRKVLAAGNSLFLIDEVNGFDHAELINWLKYPVAGYESISVTKWLQENP
jgi:hypothetical protein